eukprot:scaffold135587_cov32-Tisochrysis_lutea.AAC.2
MSPGLISTVTCVGGSHACVSPAGARRPHIVEGRRPKCVRPGEMRIAEQLRRSCGGAVARCVRPGDGSSLGGLPAAVPHARDPPARAPTGARPSMRRHGRGCAPRQPRA